MGYSPYIEGDYLYLVANNEVTPVQCARPHGWPIQNVWLAELKMPAVFPYRLVHPDGSLGSRVVSSNFVDDVSLEASLSFIAVDTDSSVLP